MKIALFGGTFNPPHIGHLRLIKSACEDIKPDKVLIIPTGSPPHKKTLVPFEERFKMAQFAFPDYEVSDIENTSEPSYTVLTLTKLREIYPDGEFFLIIGGDMLEHFTSWYEYKKILSMCKVVAAAREDNYDGLKKYADDISAKLITIPITVISSSGIRALMTPKRYIHSANVAIMCGQLSKHYGLDIETRERVFVAGIFHDICKKLADNELEVLVDESGFEINEVERVSPKLWHAIGGAKYVRDAFCIADDDIINAIRFHTVARAGMSVMEKIVYISDKISCERNYSGVEVLRSLAFKNLDEAMYEAVKIGLMKNLKKNKRIPKFSLDAYNYFNDIGEV